MWRQILTAGRNGMIASRERLGSFKKKCLDEDKLRFSTEQLGLGTSVVVGCIDMQLRLVD
jgi:hypothetical protein